MCGHAQLTVLYAYGAASASYAQLYRLRFLESNQHKRYDYSMEPESNTSPSPTPPPTPPPVVPANPGRSSLWRRLLGSRIFWIVAAVIVLIIIAIVIFLLTRPKPAAPISQNGLKDVSADELKRFTATFLSPNSNQTVSINPNTHFNNDVTVDKTLTAAQINAKIFNVTGAVSLDSLDVKNGLSVGGATLLQGNIEARQQLTVRGTLAAASASFSGNVSVNGNLSAGSLSVGTLNTTNVSASGDVSVGGHLVLNGALVSATVGPAAGGGNVTVTGNDVTGTVTINIGGSPTSGQLATVTFSRAYPKAPHVLLTPSNHDAGILQWYVVRASSFFNIETGNAPTSGQSLQFDYFITQ